MSIVARGPRSPAEPRPYGAQATVPAPSQQFRRILIAVDATSVGAHAAETGAAIARAVGAQVGLVHVVDVRGMMIADAGASAEQITEDLERSDREFLTAVSERLGVADAWQFVARGEPAKQIVAAAQEWGADLIVVGTHARTGVPRLVVGSTAEGVLRHARCPVIVVPPAEKARI